MISKNKGFTLVEVVIVLTVMALLAVAALPRIINIVGQAKKGSRDNIVAAIRSGIQLQKISTVSETTPLGAYPGNLDTNPGGGAACTGANACFGNILEPGQQINDSKWVKINNAGPVYTYDYDPGPSVSNWAYNTANGTFTCFAGAC